MWIDRRIKNPLREGYYKTLVDYDGLGNLVECDQELFNGQGWDLYKSNSNFILYWQATKEDYESISKELEDEHR